MEEKDSLVEKMAKGGSFIIEDPSKVTNGKRGSSGAAASSGSMTYGTLSTGGRGPGDAAPGNGMA